MSLSNVNSYDVMNFSDARLGKAHNRHIAILVPWTVSTVFPVCTFRTAKTGQTVRVSRK
jgi:hypothetical protein